MKLFLHIGLNKTGTTFTQRDIFQKIANKNIHYYGPDLGIYNKKLFNRFKSLEFSLEKCKDTLSRG